MTRHASRRLGPRPLALACACLTLVTLSLSAESREPWSDWTTLRMRARGVPLFSGQFEMERDGSRRLETRATARFLGATIARSRTETVFDADGRTRRHLRESKKHARRYVFEESGYTAEKLVPNGSRETPVDTWDVVATQRFDYPTARPRIYDYYGMLLRLRDEPLGKVGDEVSILVATSKGPASFTVSVAEARRSDRKLRNARTGESRVVTVDELRLLVSPADPAKADEAFLDMEGDTEIWVEAGSKTPIEIEGRVPKAGRVRLELVELG